MKKLFFTILIVIIISAFTGCSLFPSFNQPTQATETTSQETTQTETQKITTTDEFPTVDDDDNDDADSETYTEANGRWSVTLPEVWDELGDIIESSTDGIDYVRFVYEEAYEDYGAGHVFTIGTSDASNPYDVSSLPHGKEIYLDKNIQVFVEYPTDLQYGGADGSKISEQMIEYNKLKDTIDEIIDSLKVL